MSLIPADNNFLVFAAVAFLGWVGFAIERTKIGKVTTGIVWTGGLAILLSNIHVIPQSADAYDFVKRYLVPLAIPLFLLKVNLREIFSETGKTLIAFMVGAVTTVIGALVGVWLLDLGVLENDLAGVFTATYIGGSLNFAASAEALQFEDDVLLSAALAADSIVGKSYLLILAALPSLALIQKFFPGGVKVEEVTGGKQNISDEQPTVYSMMTALALASIICGLGYVTADALDMTSYGIMFVTAFALVPGTLFPEKMKELHGAYSMGLICAVMFFAAIGAGADVATLVTVAPSIIVFAVIIISVHALLLFPIARALKLDVGEIITASNACILGPTTAAALAAARGWNHLVTPGLLTGVFGYGIGTFVGVALAKLL